jgi:plastocyanin
VGPFVALVAFVLVASASAPAAVASPPPGAPSCPVFPADNIWHADISGLPVHSRSSAWISSMGGTSVKIHPDFGPSGLSQPYGLPYTVVDGSYPTVSVDFLYADESDPGPYPFGPDTPIEMGSDRHALIIDRDACLLYELFDAEYSAQGSTAGSGAIFDLRSNALRPADWTSADAAGLPIFAGLVRLDEVQAGAIDHAIRVTASQTDRSYVWPARHQAGSANDPNLPPMGARFRLKASFDISGFRTDTQVILRAMQTYGLIVADNGSSWFFQGTSEDGWEGEMLDELKTVPAGAFEGVDASSLMVDPDSGQVAGAPPPPPPPPDPADVTVTVTDFKYSPKTVTAAKGDTVGWTFNGPSAHTATDQTGMGLFDSGSRGTGSSYSFTFVGAGTYRYGCTIHPTQMSANVRVPLTVSPATGTTGTSFTITWASGSPPAGYVVDVQVKRPGATKFVSWKSGVTGTGASFTPDAGAGTYQFRGRLRNTANGKAAKYSPVASFSAS